jgi:hypothetical protein
MDRKPIERYAAGATAVAKAIEGLSKSELTAQPVAGTWSIQQIVFHLMESELIATDRMKRIIAMENPLLIGFDETAFGKHLLHGELDPRLACELVEKNRQLTAELLRRLPDEAFARTGVHNERGKISLLELLIGTADHLDHHLKFIRQKRDLLGKPLA